ncbi:MAG: glycosyltransferase [Cryobacterium sp.]|nr:glycosyltransferase [Cryobacterium sp.]
MPSHTPPASTAAPQVAVLLATYNGRRWLPEQLASILDQDGVAVRVIALDDESTDGTHEWLLEQAKADPRITVLPRQGASGSAAANFYRLLRSATTGDSELVAFADQDDVWLPGKLARHAHLLAEKNSDGVSSNVTSFTASGTRTLVRKNYPQRRFDYLLESPGPGSTFLLTPRLARLVRDILDADDGLALGADYHDWLIYALCRARGWGWFIDDTPSVDYRQHEHNAMGANVGVGSGLSRLALIRQHWHRNQAILLTRIALDVADDEQRAGLQRMFDLFTSRGTRARLALARRSGQLRRRPRDRQLIGLLIATGIW